MGNMWMITAFCILALSTTCKPTDGHSSATASQGTQTTTKPLFTDYRSEYYELGKDVHLKCTNKTWNEMLYIIWTLNIKGKECRITASTTEPPHDTCNDGKVLHNITNGESYLLIPHFEETDAGIYSCETAIVGSSSVVKINVSALVSPQISTGLDLRDGKREAVCSAAGGKPAASVSWTNTWNSSVTQTSTQNSDGSFTVESRFILPDPASADNLSCIVTHPSWEDKKAEKVPSVSDERHIAILKIIIIALGSISFVVAVLIGFYITRNHLSKLRNCCKSKISASPQPKPPEDVEEVEPYASYVQRVNSIYNSSAELCNA